MISIYRGYEISYDRWQGYYEITFRGDPEVIERADTIEEAKTKIDGYLKDVK
jgi:hypothetical protein